MRRYYYISILTFFAVILCSCSREQANIYGNITSLPDGMVYLRVYEGGSMRTLDSTQAVAGRFTIVMPQILPNILYLQFESNPNYFIPVMIEGHDVSVSGNFNYYDEITITGTAANDALGDHRSQVRRHDILLRTVEGQIEIEDTSKIHSSDYLILVHKQDSLKSLIAQCRRDFVSDHRGSIVSAYLANLTLSDTATLAQIDSLLGELDPTMADNAFMRRLHRRREALKR